MPTQRLTDKLLKGLKPPRSGQLDVWDEVLPSFGVRIGTTGRKSFFVGTRINGKYRRVTLKPAYDALTLAEARSQARKIIADAHAGIGPEVRKKREEKGTFGAVAAAFMADYAKDHRTKREMQRKIDVDLADWHDRQIAEISRGDIKELVRVKARTSPISANRVLSLITKIFNWALKEELIGASPAMQIDRPAKEA
jgi:hypothetical protein